MKFNTNFYEIGEILNKNNGESKMIAISARPGMGKTTLLLDIMHDMSQLNNGKLLFISLNDSQAYVLNKKSEALSKSLNKIRIVQSDSLTVGDIENEISKTPDLSLVFIDNIETMTGGDLSATLSKLKDICLKNSVSIIYTCHLSRKSEQRENMRPTICDIDSNIVAHSDAVFALYRQSYYTGDDPAAMLRTLKTNTGELIEISLLYDSDNNIFNYKGQNMEERVELSVHTKLSDDVSTIDVDEAFDFAIYNGHKAIGFTNLNNVQDFPKIQRASRKRGNIKTIYGARLYYETDIGGPLAATLLIKNQAGVKNLYKLISTMTSMGNTKITHEKSIQKHRKNLLLGSSGDLSELFFSVMNENKESEVKAIAQKYDYIEIFPTDDIKTRLIYKKLVQIGKELSIPVVATGDCHYYEKVDEICRRVVKEFKGGCDDNTQQYLRTTQEMLEAFAYLGDEDAYEVVVKNSNLIADMIEHVSPVSRDFPAINIPKAEETMLAEIKAKAASIYGANLPVVISKRLEFEFSRIVRNDFASYYVLAYYIAKYARDNGRIISSRGTVGSSLVAFLLGITNVNPLPPHYYCKNCKHVEFVNDNTLYTSLDLEPKKCSYCGEYLVADGHNVPFESFAGFDGDKVPDFDICVEESFKADVLRYLCELFGADHVLQANNILSIFDSRAEMYAKMYEEVTNCEFDEDLETYITNKIQGVKRKETLHPCGILIVPSDKEICDYTPFYKKENTDVIPYVSHLSYYYLQDSLYKSNICGNELLQKLSDLQNATEMTIKDVNFGDEVLELLKNNDVFGVPDFDIEFMQKLMRDIKPQTFGDIIKMLGFSHGTNVWTNNGEHLIKKGIPISKIPTFRDDVMSDLIGIGADKADAYRFCEIVRKGLIARNRLDTETIDYFKELTKLLGDWYFDYCSKVRYMFPKSHAIEYALISFACAWYKKHYPNEFAKIVLS